MYVLLPIFYSLCTCRRVAVVDYKGQILLSEYVQPTMPVTDYRTSTTGIVPADLSAEKAVPLRDIQMRVASLLRGKVVVGHSLRLDLSVLGIPHPAAATRDVALYQPSRTGLKSKTLIRLPTFMWHFMRRKCQQDTLCPVENSRAAIDFYRSHEKEWEVHRRGNTN